MIKLVPLLENVTISPADIQLKKGLSVIDNPDYICKFDIDDDQTATLIWINTKTNKYKGKDIFKALLEYLKGEGVNKVYAWGTRGKVYGVQAVGHYVMLRWGFIPENMNYINKPLKTNYKNIKDALNDPEFLVKWKQDGDDFKGVFDMKSNSLSWKLLNI
jgi:hypothetical protein